MNRNAAPKAVPRNRESLPELWTCLDCGKCTAVCPVARTGLGYSPRRFFQQAIRKGVDSILSSRVLFACLGCDRCTTVCPSGIGITALILRLRAMAFKQGIPGEPAHAGILQTLMRMMADSEVPQNRLEWVDSSLRVSRSGEVLYFVGCAPYFEPLFNHLGVRPLRSARNAIRLLNHVGIEPVLLPDERCCGHDLLWQGDVDNFRKLAERNLASIRATGVRTVVFSCPECLRTFKIDYPKQFGPLGFEVVHITQLLSGLEPDRFRPGFLKTRATFHDPCRLGRHLGIYDPPRTLLESIPGLELVEMKHNRETATCCGGTCWMECGAAVKSLQNQRLGEARSTGADRMVTACPKCDIHFSCAIADSEYDGPAIVNIVDLLAESVGLSEPSGPEAAAVPGEKGNETSA